MNLSIVIPAFNESDNIRQIIEELCKVLNDASSITKREIIVVDDHSGDNTFGVVKEMNLPDVKCIRLSRRSGSHTALRAGMREASGDAVLCISADGQDDPACIIGMFNKLKEGSHVVWALRKDRANEPWHIRKSAQAFYKLLIWLGGAEDSGVDIARANFFMIDSTVIKAINNCFERNTSLFGLIMWLGFNQDSVEYERRLRRSGSSRWRFKHYLRLAKDWLIGFSGLPLTIMSIVGALVMMLGICYAFIMGFNFISGRAVNGWSLVIMVILLIGGVQMVMLGIMGEYIWRNLDESRNRPLFFIEKRSDLLKGKR